MTTHFVEIRLKLGGPTAPWEALTHDPIPLKDAEGLCKQIGSSWESRIVPLGTGAFALLNLPVLLERLNLITTVPDDLIERCKDTPPGILFHEDDVISCLRNGLFGVFERYRYHNLTRWRSEDHKVVHTKKCKGGKQHTHTKVLPAVTGKYLDAVSELAIRAQHVTTQTIVGLGIVAELRLLTPKLHVVSCPACEKSSEAVSVVAEVVWGKHQMRREYAL